MTKILSNDSKPTDFDPNKLKTGMIVEFVYSPLIGRKREYQCKVVSTSGRNLDAIVLMEYPVRISWSGHLHYPKRFTFKRMKIYRVSPQQEHHELSQAQLAGMCLGEDGNYMDEHGIVR